MKSIKDYDFCGKRVFISGPMTGYEDWNRAKFAETEAMLREAGAISVYNPAIDAPIGEDTHSHSHWMLHTLSDLVCVVPGVSARDNNRSFWDVLVLLPGWQNSSGARAEHEVAKVCGIDIFELEPSASLKDVDWEAEYKALKAKYETVLALLGGSHVVLDFFKDGDVCHVVTTDGEEIYDYQKWLDGHTPVYDKYSREILEIAQEFERSCGNACAMCEHVNPNYPDEDDEMCVLAIRLKALCDSND